MKRFASLSVVFFLFTILIFSNSAYADENARDGNWWNAQQRSSKLSYITGFYDGMTLGRSFTMWGFMEDKKIFEKCAHPCVKSYSEYNAKYLTNVVNSQLSDGLDVFYSDYRNRKIAIHSAVWLVLNSIAGTPKEKLDEMIEKHRSNTR